ncbi:GNAT family N-acetyltransferase [bacterium]|nr:GNAT family N-acetyltransferase [candidate division CSSED10-310 bacterium]
MEVKHMTIEDRTAYARLRRYAFTPQRNDYQHINCLDEDIPGDWLYGAYEHETMISGAICLRFRLRLRGADLAMGGVSSVATRPECRNRGAIRQLMEAMLGDLHRASVPLSVLYPFKYSYWEKFGYKLADEAVFYQIPIEDILARPNNDRTFTEVYGITDDIKRLYLESLHRNNYMVLREARHWGELDKKTFKFICLDQHGQPRGYVLLKFLENLPPHAKGHMKHIHQTLFCPEIVWLDEPTRRALFAFIWGHRDQRKFVAFSRPSGEPVIDLLREPKVTMRFTRVNSMARIVDLQAALTGITYPISDFSLRLRVNDPDCPWNNGLFRLENRAGETRLVPDTGEGADLETSIGHLTQLYTGFRTIHQLADQDLVTATHASRDLLARMLPGCSNFLRDFF